MKTLLLKMRAVRVTKATHIRLALAFMLASTLIQASAQVVPEPPTDPQARAVLEAQGEAAWDDMAIKVLQGRPAIAITAMALVNGAPSRLTNASVRDATELTLRRNGIPVVQSCDTASNCGRLVTVIRASCLKDLFPASPGLPTGVCVVYVRVEYREAVNSRRLNAPVGVFGDLWDDDGLGLKTSDSFEEAANKRLSEAIEKFALYYLRANPAK